MMPGFTSSPFWFFPVMTFFAITFSVPKSVDAIIPQPKMEANLTWILARFEGDGKYALLSESRIFNNILLACVSSMEDMVL